MVEERTKADITKEKVVAAVFEIVASEGMKGLTTRKLCEKAGIAKGTLYHHFENMDDIVIQSLEILSYKMMDGFKAMSFDSVEHFFVTIGLMAIDSVEKQKEKGLKTTSLMDELINNSDMNKATKIIHQKWYELTKSKILELAEHDISDEVASEIAKTVNIVIAGFKTMLYYEDDLDSIKKLWKKQAHRLASFTDENKWRD